MFFHKDADCGGAVNVSVWRRLGLLSQVGGRVSRVRGVGKVWEDGVLWVLGKAIKSENPALNVMEKDEGCHFDNSFEFVYNHATSFTSY